MEKEQQEFLLKLARRAIEHYLKTGEKMELPPAELPYEKLIEEGACFVCLKINDELRGCMGSLYNRRPLFMDVIKNAVAAAFGDIRFPPVKESDLEKIKISISILTEPVPLKVSSPEEVLEKLDPTRHGVILQQGVERATYLPAVWKEIPDKVKFLETLGMKAALGPQGWKDPRTEFFVYEAEEFSEK